MTIILSKIYKKLVCFGIFSPNATIINSIKGL